METLLFIYFSGVFISMAMIGFVVGQQGMISDEYDPMKVMSGIFMFGIMWPAIIFIFIGHIFS